MNKVILTTERLWLREMLRSDVDDLLEIWGNPVAMRMYPKTLDRKEMLEGIERQLARYAQDGHGLWSVLLKGEDTLIGDCGLAIHAVDGVDELEVGYHFKPSFWGQGYATEAARACMEYAFDKLSTRRIISMIRPENLPSRRVAERNGLHIEKELFWRGYQHYVYVFEQA